LGSRAKGATQIQSAQNGARSSVFWFKRKDVAGGSEDQGVDKRGLNKHGLRVWIGFVRPKCGSLVNMVIRRKGQLFKDSVYGVMVYSTIIFVLTLG
jgi:hypothetical protein